jgi:haloacetate dehalogenase
MLDFFTDFAEHRIDLTHGRHFRLRTAGTGPTLVMLHGMPQTQYMWHRVAPALAEHFTVICPDLTGYGESYKPPATPDHAPYSKRAMAQDIIDLLNHLNIDTFRLVGHDRGARVSHRLALDHPTRVSHLAMLDIIPTIEHFERAEMRFAMGYYHWFFLAQPHPFPEELINLNPQSWLHSQSGRHSTDNSVFNPAAMADYTHAVTDPATITAMCEDYRAAATIDLVHDRASRDQKQKIACPTLVLWGERGLVNRLYQPLEVWRDYCAGPLSGHTIAAGHYLAEEAPAPTIAAMQAFLSGR